MLPCYCFAWVHYPDVAGSTRVCAAALAQNLQLSEKGLCRAVKLGQDEVLKTASYVRRQGPERG